jgi:hypothetical protein
VEVARVWVEKLAAAIHAEDRNHMITVGAIPWAMVWPNARPIIYAPEVSGPLDFVSIHVYPKTGEVDRALTALGTYEIGKPLLIEETFPLNCTIVEMDGFLRRSKARTAGYVSFYWGRTIDEYKAATKKKAEAALISEWLGYFQRNSEFMKAP